MDEREKQIGLLFSAELQFRLATAVDVATMMKEQPIDVPYKWSHGKHIVEFEEIALRQDQAEYASWHLHRTATFLMAVEMRNAIKFSVKNPKKSEESNIRSAYQISRLIRNAFSHSPFDPIWYIDPDCRSQIFKVENIIEFDTTSLDQKPFDWRHYGGPLALLRLCRYVRFQILKDEKKPRENIPIPKEIYYQQGSLILKKLKNENESK